MAPRLNGSDPVSTQPIREATGPAEPGKLTCRFEAPSPSDWRSLRCQIAPEWRFLASGWAAAWAESHLPYDHWRLPLRYLTVRSATGLPTGVLPLATLRFGPLSFAAGAGQFLPYRGLPLAGDGAAMAATCATMAEALTDRLRSRLGLRMGPVLAQDPMCNALLAALRRSGWEVGTLPAGHAFVVALPDTVPKFEQINAGLIRRVNYYERRLRRAGKLDIVRYDENSGCDWNMILSRVAEIEQNSWISKNNGTRLFSTSTGYLFWSKVLSDEFLSSCITIWLLYLDGRPVSFSCGLDIGDIKFILANLYDEAFKTYRCGNILTRHVLTGAVRGGQRRVDWGKGDSGYKQLWHAEPEHALTDIVALPPRPASAIVKAMLRWRAGYVFS